ncbi:MAG: high frequency lysogenization protein HflD [Enterobacterales bacterium]|nr:high frequency lysogenization protein HflD [Enterobacterales bacterium]
MNLNQSQIDRAIALAGIAQSVRIVQHIAWKGETSDTDFKAIIASLLKIKADSAIAVYGGSFEVVTGLRIIKQQLDTQTPNKDPELVGMTIHLLSLHKQLMVRDDIMQQLSQGIERLSNRYSDEAFYQDNEIFAQLLADISDIYQSTISKLGNRIKVNGEPKYLKLEENQNKVRAALLCAFRSIFLWRQSGGSRWQFLLGKKAILSAADYLIKNPQSN